MNKIKDLLKLSVEERIHLVQSIWDSVAAEAEASEVDDEHKPILDKRIEAHQDDPHEVVSWEEIKKTLKNRCELHDRIQNRGTARHSRSSSMV